MFEKRLIRGMKFICGVSNSRYVRLKTLYPLLRTATVLQWRFNVINSYNLWLNMLGKVQRLQLVQSSHIHYSRIAKRIKRYLCAIRTHANIHYIKPRLEL